MPSALFNKLRAVVKSRTDKQQVEKGSSVSPRLVLFFLALILKLFFWVSTGILATAVWGIWLCAMIAVAIPATDFVVQMALKRLKPFTKLILVITLFGLIPCTLLLSSMNGISSYIDKSVQEIPANQIALERGFMNLSDSVVLIQQATQNYLKGLNPYSNSNIVTALGDSPAAYDKTTPLRVGRLANAFPYPPSNIMSQIWISALSNPSESTPEIEGKLTYPAGIFLVPAPFMLLGIHNIRFIFLILGIPALVYAFWSVKPKWRLYFALAVLGSLYIWVMASGGDNSMIYFPFLLMAWLLIPRKLWLSAFFMGVAVATKQTVWFFVPFYLVLILRRTGKGNALGTLAIITAVFMGMNLSFIIDNSHLWLSSIMAPMTDKMFPMGVGIVGIVTGGIIHVTSPLIFDALEVTTAAICMFWYYRNCKRYPLTGVILSVVPLFFAWRSLPNYFNYVDMILLAMLLNKELLFATPGLRTVEIPL